MVFNTSGRETQTPVFNFLPKCEGMCKTSALLVKADGVFLEREDVVSEDDNLVVASLVEADEELAGAELVGVHGVKQNPLLCLYSHVFVIKLRGHGTPHL